jgi:hypothetical protein
MQSPEKRISVMSPITMCFNRMLGAGMYFFFKTKTLVAARYDDDTGGLDWMVSATFSSLTRIRSVPHQQPITSRLLDSSSNNNKSQSAPNEDPPVNLAWTRMDHHWRQNKSNNNSSSTDITPSIKTWANTNTNHHHHHHH